MKKFLAVSAAALLVTMGASSAKAQGLALGGLGTAATAITVITVIGVAGALASSNSSNGTN